jgi:hypothetical protein
MHAVPRKPAAACGSSCILRWDFRQRSCELTIKCSNVGSGSHDLLLVVIEAAGMRESRASLVSAWRKLANGGGLRQTHGDAESRLPATDMNARTSIAPTGPATP